VGSEHVQVTSRAPRGTVPASSTPTRPDWTTLRGGLEPCGPAVELQAGRFDELRAQLRHARFDDPDGLVVGSGERIEVAGEVLREDHDHDPVVAALSEDRIDAHRPHLVRRRLPGEPDHEEGGKAGELDPSGGHRGGYDTDRPPGLHHDSEARRRRRACRGEVAERAWDASGDRAARFA
jgi:hypothetical protein